MPADAAICLKNRLNAPISVNPPKRSAANKAAMATDKINVPQRIRLIVFSFRKQKPNAKNPALDNTVSEITCVSPI